jgi:hypothetical protein
VFWWTFLRRWDAGDGHASPTSAAREGLLRELARLRSWTTRRRSAKRRSQNVRPARADRDPPASKDDAADERRSSDRIGRRIRAARSLRRAFCVERFTLRRGFREALGSPLFSRQEHAGERNMSLPSADHACWPRLITGEISAFETRHLALKLLLQRLRGTSGPMGPKVAETRDFFVKFERVLADEISSITR